MQKDSHRYEMLVLAVEASYLIMYIAFFILTGLEKPRKGGAPPSKDFYESCVDSLWQNGLMRLENRAAEVDLRGRLHESLQMARFCDEDLIKTDAADFFMSDRPLSHFIPGLVVALRAWKLFGSQLCRIPIRVPARLIWVLDTTFQTTVLCWYGFMAGLFSTLSLLKVDDNKFGDALFIGPSIYVFLLTSLCLMVLDQWQTLIASCASCSFFVIPQMVAIFRVFDQKGPLLALLLDSMNQFALIIGVVALSVARCSAWRDKQLDFQREEQLKSFIIDEKVKRCAAEFAVQLAQGETLKATDGESSYLYQTGNQPWHSPPSTQSAPAPERLAQGTRGDCDRCDCLPMNAKVYLEGRPAAVPASQLEVGDRLLCYDHLAGSIRFVDVNDCGVVSGECQWSHITMADGTALSVTAEHPVRVVGEVDADRGAFGLGGGQVVHAGELRPSKDMLKILRLGAVPVQTIQLQQSEEPRVRVNLHQCVTEQNEQIAAIVLDAFAGVEMTAVAVESSDALQGRGQADLQVQNTFIAGFGEDIIQVPPKPLSAPGAVTGGALRLHTLPESCERCEVSADDCLADLETNLDSDVADAGRASSSSEGSPDLLHAKGCCQPCLFQSRYFADPEKYPACTKPDCLARYCHLPHSEEYIAKYKSYKRRYEKKNRTAYRKNLEAL
ncbi:unnamed protein product [Cladocopium goreaui]|uniref:Glucosylceramidase n=1 Tax=Cladocopium goreaui TaxID=2562237 RepID=A0A9P1D8N1_9DINO|nr:unnamed protein product [Cladocopium goreaui]